MIARRLFLGYAAAALAAQFFPKVAVGDGIALKNIPHPPFADDNLLVSIREIWWDKYDIDERAIWWGRADGGVDIGFSDGSRLKLPSPAGEILMDLKIRRGRDI